MPVVGPSSDTAVADPEAVLVELGLSGGRHPRLTTLNYLLGNIDALDTVRRRFPPASSV